MRTVDFTGTVSESTMRTQDVLPACMSVLKEYHEDAWLRIKSDIASEFDIMNYDCLWSWGSCDLRECKCPHNTDTYDCQLEPRDTIWQSEFMSYILNEDIWDAMNEIAPEGYYFGAHPGDGCDYGYWTIEEEF